MPLKRRRIVLSDAQRDRAGQSHAVATSCWELKDAHFKEKRAYFISLLDHQPAMVDLHSQVNRHERSIRYSVLGSVLGPAIQK